MSSFGDDVETWINSSVKSVSAVVRKTGLDCFKGVVKKTPVDTGSHRGNWNMSVNSIDTGYNPAITDVSGNTAVKTASAIIRTVTGDAEINISNSGPAINVLEYGGYPTRGGSGPSNGPNTINGFSRQAPKGMVRVTIAEFEQLFNKNALGEGFR